MDSQELQRLKNKYDIIGNDAALNRALETAVAVAPTDLTVLITGESGVGKENIPKIITPEPKFTKIHNYKFNSSRFSAKTVMELDEEITSEFVALYDVTADEVVYSKNYRYSR